LCFNFYVLLAFAPAGLSDEVNAKNELVALIFKQLVCGTNQVN